MKKALLLPIMLCILLVLSACGGNAEDEFGSFCAELEQAQSIGFTAKLRAEYEDKTANFKLAYTQNAEGIKVTIIEPETISGISARVKDDSARLEYDGVILDIGSLDANGLCPMSALPVTVMALRNAHVDSVWEENGMTAARLIVSDDTSVTVWLDGEMIPCSAEISSGWNAVVFIEFCDWEMK